MSTSDSSLTVVPSRRWGQVWAWSAVTWVAVWVLFSLQTIAYYQMRGQPVPPAKHVYMLVEWMLWALFTPAVLWYCWRRPLTGATWKSHLPWQLAGAVVVPAVYLVPLQFCRYTLSHALDQPDLYRELTPSFFFTMWVNAFVTNLDIVLISHALAYARDSRAKDLRTSRLEARLAEAQLRMLRMQLHPHFLFNTLHTISALMHKDLKAADRMLALLGDLLRDSFEKVGAQEVSLKQELGFLERYLEIEKTRFRDRLVVEVEVDADVLDAEVPNLILQPLVENAIRHGIGRRRDAGRIALVARRQGESLDLRVRDNGPGLPGGGEVALGTGVGLANTQARLEQLYGSAHRFELRNRPEGGLEVVLMIPFRLHRPEGPRTVPAEHAAEPAPAASTGAAVVATSR